MLKMYFRNVIGVFERRDKLRGRIIYICCMVVILDLKLCLICIYGL